MEHLQSMGSDGARELRVVVGPRAGETKPRTVLTVCAGERTRA